MLSTYIDILPPPLHRSTSTFPSPHLSPLISPVLESRPRQSHAPPPTARRISVGRACAPGRRVIGPDAGDGAPVRDADHGPAHVVGITRPGSHPVPVGGPAAFVRLAALPAFLTHLLTCLLTGARVPSAVGVGRGCHQGRCLLRPVEATHASARARVTFSASATAEMPPLDDGITEGRASGQPAAYPLSPWLQAYSIQPVSNRIIRECLSNIRMDLAWLRLSVPVPAQFRNGCWSHRPGQAGTRVI